MMRNLTGFINSLIQLQDFSSSSLFILDVATLSKMACKLISATYILYLKNRWLKARRFPTNMASFVNSKYHIISSETVFLVVLGKSSFPVGQEVYEKSIEKFFPSWEQARTQND